MEVKPFRRVRNTEKKSTFILFHAVDENGVPICKANDKPPRRRTSGKSAMLCGNCGRATDFNELEESVLIWILTRLDTH